MREFVFNLFNSQFEFTFEWPWMFILLLLPFLFRNWTKPADKSADESADQTEQALNIPFLNELESSAKTPPQADSSSLFKGLLPKLLLFASWGLIIAAIANPMWIGKMANAPISGRNIIVAVDLSGSMAQHDFALKGNPITRLDATKKVAIDFIKQRVGDRVGLILFADHAYLQAPLTRDRQTVMKLLSEAELGLAGERTALGNAIGLAVKKVQEQADQEHVLVLMTDGAATVGVSVDEAIRFANKVNLKIYTLGIGSPSSPTSTPLSTTPLSTMPLSTPLSTTSVSRNMQTNGLDEATLKKIADKTGGLYFRATNVAQLESVYQELDTLEPIIDTSQAWYPRQELFQIPLSLAFVLLLLLGILRFATRWDLRRLFRRSNTSQQVQGKHPKS